MSGRDIEFGIRITGDGKVLISEAGKAEKALEGITTSVKGTQRASEAMTGSMARMGHAMAAAFSIREMASAFDAWQGLYSRVDRASESIEQTGRSMTAIYGIAQRSGVALAEVGDVYQKISRNARQYGLEQADTLRVTEAIANAVRLSGGSAAGAQAALMQFGQALSAGQLRGEELNSVLEQTPELADAIARGMGKTVGELKALGEAGQLTAKEVLGAISQESARLEQEVGAMASTVGQATTRLQNAFTKWVGTETAGAAAVATTALNTVAEHFDKVATGAMLAGTAWAGIRVASLATGFAASAGAMTAAAGGLAVALGPIAPIALAVTAAVVAGAVAWQDYGTAGKTATEEVAVGVRRLQSDLARANVEISAMTRKAYDAQLAEFSQRRAAAAVNVANANMALERFSGNKVSEEYREIYIRAVDANREMKAVNTSLAAFEARAGEVGRKPLDEYFEKFGSKAYKAAQSVKDLDAAYKKVRDRAAADGVGADMLGKLDADYRAERAARAGAGKAAATRASSSTDDARVLADWKERVALQKAESEATDKLTRTQQAYVKLQADLDNGRVKLTSSARAQVEAEAQNALQLEAVAEATKKAKAEQEAMAKAQEAAVSAVRADTQALLNKLAVAGQEAETYGMTEESVYRLLAARAEDRAEMNAFGDANDAIIAELKAQAKAYLDLADAAGAKAGREAQRRAVEESRASAQKFADDLERSLTDALMRGFEAGKGFGESFVDSLRNTLKTAALKAVVQVVAQPVTSSFAGGSTGVAGMSGGGSGGIGNLLSMGNSAAGMSSLSAYTGAAGYMQFGSMASSFGTALSAAGAGADLSAAIAAYEAAGMGATATSLSAGASVAGSIGGGAASALGSVMSGLATAAPYLAVALLVAQQLGAFKGPTYHHGGAYMADTEGTLTKATNSNLSDFNLGWGAYTVDRSSGFDDAMLAMSQGVAKQIEESIKAFGGKTGNLTVGARFASDNDDWSEGAIRIVNEAGERVFDFTKRYTSDSGKALQQFGEDSTRALLATLQATDLNDEFDALFRGLDPLKASVAEINALLEKASAIQQEVSAVQSAVDSAFLAPAEQLAKAFGSLSVAAPETAAQFQALVRAQDLNTASGRELAASLMSLYPAFSQIQDAVSSEAAGLQQRIWQLTGDTKAIREAELAKIDPANRALQERVWALEDEQSAQQAMASAIAGVSAASSSAVDSLASLSDALHSALGSAGDETGAASAAARARAQAQLGSALAIARASGGSVLPDEAAISGALSVVGQSSTGMFGTHEEYLRDRLRTANTIAGLASIVDARRGIVPGFAVGGSHTGGWRVVGEAGPELEYTGPSQIVSNGDSKSLLSLDEVVAEIRLLREEMRAGQVAIARAGEKVAQLQTKWDAEGTPGVRT